MSDTTVNLEWLSRTGDVVGFGIAPNIDAAKARAARGRHPIGAVVMRVVRGNIALARFRRQGDAFVEEGGNGQQPSP